MREKIEKMRLSGLMDKMRTFYSRYTLASNIALAATVLLLPFIVGSQYVMRIVIMIGVYAILAQSLGLITGYAGQTSLGHAAFYAIGAYTSAIVSIQTGWSFFITAPIAAVFAALMGLALGLPTLRLSGTYLAITTLGFSEFVRMVLLNWEPVTNGPLGISRIPRPSILGVDLIVGNNGLYYLMLVFLVITTVVIYNIVNSKVGRALMSIRDDELAATMMGVKTTYYKVLVFVIGAFFAGLAGAFYAHMIRFIDPNTFTFDTSILILSIVILGGMGTIKGMFVGSALLISFPEVMRFLQEYRFVVYGVVLVLTMRFRPQGILGGQKKTPYRLPKGVTEEVTDNKEQRMKEMKAGWHI
jgi:branched-chain amino acid transport system permease protein